MAAAAGSGKLGQSTLELAHRCSTRSDCDRNCLVIQPGLWWVPPLPGPCCLTFRLAVGQTAQHSRSLPFTPRAPGETPAWVTCSSFADTTAVPSPGSTRRRQTDAVPRRVLARGVKTPGKQHGLPPRHRGERPVPFSTRRIRSAVQRFDGSPGTVRDPAGRGGAPVPPPGPGPS